MQNRRFPFLWVGGSGIGFGYFFFDSFFIPFPSWSYENQPVFILVTSVFFFPYFMAVIPLYLLLISWFFVSCKTNVLFYFIS